MKDEKSYSSDSLSSLGFIHCCRKEQLKFVRENWFSDEKNLVVLKINSDKVTAKLVNENLEGGDELFPHIYGPINLDAVISIQKLD